MSDGPSIEDKMNKASRLVLGTAQLGMPYGIANSTGQPDPQAAETILESAWAGGIREFDTAQAYCASEKILGTVIEKRGWREKIRITTKLFPDIDHLSREAVVDSVKQSLRHLRISKIHCLLLHREHLLQRWGEGIGNIMKGLMESRLVESVGISVYSPETAIRALNTAGITAVQLPSNILDRRFERAGIFGDGFPVHKRIYIRSVFLQGLLFLKPDDLPANMQFACHYLDLYESLVEKYRLSKLQLALGYAKQAYPSAHIIVGAEAPQQVTECLRAWQSVVLPRDLLDVARRLFRNVDEKILNPGRWPN